MRNTGKWDENVSWRRWRSRWRQSSEVNNIYLLFLFSFPFYIDHQLLIYSIHWSILPFMLRVKSVSFLLRFQFNVNRNVNHQHSRLLMIVSVSTRSMLILQMKGLTLRFHQKMLQQFHLNHWINSYFILSV